MGLWKVSKGDGCASGLLQCRRVGRCMVVQRRWVGQGMVSTGDGWAGGLLHSVVDGLAEVWSAMQMDGPVVGGPMETGGLGSSMGWWTVSNG